MLTKLFVLNAIKERHLGVLLGGAGLVVCALVIAVLVFRVTRRVWRRISQLRLRRNLASIFTNGEEVTYHMMPRNGDSLFMAVAHQLDPGATKLKERAHNLRLGVCYHLLNGLDKYTTVLTASIAAQGQRYPRLLSLESKILRFLRDLATSGVPAGDESLQALADMMLVDIFVFQQDGGKRWFKSSSESINRTIGIVRHRLDSPGQYHYDSVHSISTYVVEQPNNGADGASSGSTTHHIEITELNGNGNGITDTPYLVELANNG